MPKKASILPFQILIKEGGIHFEGQILHLSKLGETSSEKDSIWRNLKRTFHFYTPKRIDEEKRNLTVEIDNRRYNVPLDKYGYFNYDDKFETNLKEVFRQVRFFLGESRIYMSDSVDLRSLLVQNKGSKMGIISDIDDTLIVSHSTNPIMKSTTLSMNNVYSRKIVTSSKEIIKQYENKECDFFYVTNSETNLYLHIKWFLKLNNLPDGPIFTKKLRSYKNLLKFSSKKGFFMKNKHKIERIEYIIENYPQDKYILIGDSSQNDPEIYYFISQKYPSKIEKIYIREITKEKRKEDLVNLKDNLKKLNIELEFYQ